MNRMIRDIAMHNVHTEERAIFSVTNTASNNATKYAIAKKQPAYGLIAKFGRDRWSNKAKHIAKQIHDIEIHSFDHETLEPGRVSPTRMEWRQQANGGIASAIEAATSYTVLCLRNVAHSLRSGPNHEATDWMANHGCGKEYSTRNADVQQVQDRDAQVQNAPPSTPRLTANNSEAKTGSKTL